MSTTKQRERLSSAIPSTLLRQVKAQAALRGMTLTAAVQQALTEWLDRSGS